MAYTVLARKYRPQTFADLVGQEHVTRTLSNAIHSHRVAHAFLFTGVRGVGKTTTARILAKALNCERGPTPEPCGECDACVDITAGRDTDVLEMDGASNNSVEDVRRLQESIPYRPARDRFKIVIVDEVHMLSTGAFNAFLKTLEEPPEHVKFIFATTEIHKVPITIRSRCQRYDFRLIPQAVVTRAVRTILEAEGVTADDAAVAIVAREAAGSMRDALTLLDQIVAYAGNELVGDEVARVLGIADRDVLHRVAAAVLSGDGADVLRQVDQLASHGLDMLHFARQLLELFRDMVVLRVGGPDTDLVAMVDEERKRAAETAGSVDLQELQRAFSGLAKIVEDVGQSGAPRTTLEMGLVRLATRPPLLPLTELVARLEDIERRGGGRGGAPPGASRGGARGGNGGGGTRAGATARAEEPPTARTTDGAPSTSPNAEPNPTQAGASSNPAAARGSLSSPTPSPTEVEPASTEATLNHPTSKPRCEPGPASAGSTPAEPVPKEVEPEQAWEAIVASLMDDKPALGAVLQHAAPMTVSAEEIVLAFPRGSFVGRRAEALDGRTDIAQAAKAILGSDPRVEITYVDDPGPGTRTIVAAEKERREARFEEARRKALSHPLVLEAAQLFRVPPERMSVRVDLE